MSIFTCMSCLRLLRSLINYQTFRLLYTNLPHELKTPNARTPNCSYYCPGSIKWNTSVKMQIVSNHTMPTYDSLNRLVQEGKSQNELLKRHVETNNESNLKVSTLNTSFRLPYQEQLLSNKLEELLDRKDEIKNEEWNLLKSSVLEIRGSLNKENIDAVLMQKCCDIKSLHLGKAYYNYLIQCGIKINRATYGNFLRLFYVCSSSCTDEDVHQINEVYGTLLKVHPQLDCYTAEKAVFALCLTSNWREYENLFKTISLFYEPSGAVYSVVTRTAFKNKDFDLGWKLIEEMELQGKKVPDEVFIDWIHIMKHRPEGDHEQSLTKVLDFFKSSNSMPSLDLCELLKQSFEKADKNRRGTFTRISKIGECRSCYAALEPAEVSQEDFDQLRSVFLDPVLIGKDIFQKTKPEEFRSFLEFIEKSSYNVVLDGLNIALKIHKRDRSTSAFATQLGYVVRHFNKLNKTVFVIGRKHMEKWPLREMKYVYDNAHVFLADDLSQDDPFLLYAALYSGLGTCFVSRDFMRGHKFLLANPKIQNTFQKWQAKHQYFIKYIGTNGNVHLQDPVRYLQKIQQNNRGDWHIPYEVEDVNSHNLQPDLYHAHWLCLTRHNHAHAQKSEKNPVTNTTSKPKYERIGYRVSFDD